ncbi:alpha/beta hydrolase [Burkholderia sp. Tr-860]|nr:alpha/beta hydrolase [Burkholderia sp. Tr-860]
MRDDARVYVERLVAAAGEAPLHFRLGLVPGCWRVLDPRPVPAPVPLFAARFDGLPPLLAVGAEHDPLRDDARVYVERIVAAGGEAHFHFGSGLVHGCWRALDLSPGAARMHATICEFLEAGVMRCARRM